MAHHGESWLDAEAKIEEAINLALKVHYKRLKIIHGKGTDGHTKVICNKTIEVLKKYERKFGYKLVEEKHNKGAHILYFNK